MPSIRFCLPLSQTVKLVILLRRRLSKKRRSISHTLSCVTSSGGAASLLVVAEPIACTEASHLQVFSCTCPSPATFDKLREIERAGCALHTPRRCAMNACDDALWPAALSAARREKRAPRGGAAQ